MRQLHDERQLHKCAVINLPDIVAHKIMVMRNLQKCYDILILTDAREHFRVCMRDRDIQSNIHTLINIYSERRRVHKKQRFIKNKAVLCLMTKTDR